MATDPNFAAYPMVAVGQVSTANTNRDGTGTIATIYTAPANGARIDEIIIEATGTTTAGMVRLFIHDGTNARLWQEVTVTAATPSGTVAAFRSAVRNDTRADLPLLLLPNASWSLRASTNNAETFNVIAIGGSF